ncbi:MAG: hypothetical protein AAGF12_31345 [Myxococcota bacterium]
MGRPFFVRGTVMMATIAMMLTPRAGMAQSAGGAWRLLDQEADRALREGEYASAAAIYDRALGQAREEGAEESVRADILSKLSLARTCDERECPLDEVNAALRRAPVPPEVSVPLPAAIMTSPGDPPSADTIPYAATLYFQPRPSAVAEVAADPPVEPPAPADPVVEEPPVEVVESPPPRFWAEASVIAGFAYVGDGLPADSRRPPGFSDDSPWEDCDARGENCTVRVASPGLSELFAIRVAAGLRVVGPVSLGLSARVQPAAGRGTMAGWLPELVGRIETAEDTVRFAGQLGVGFGQIQARPPQQETTEGPFVRSGLGWVSLSAIGTYRLEERVEFFLEFTPRMSFTDVLPVLDVGLGIRFRG